MPRKSRVAKNDAEFTRRYSGVNFNEVACHPGGAEKPHWKAIGIDTADARNLIQNHEAEAHPV